MACKCLISPHQGENIMREQEKGMLLPIDHAVSNEAKSGQKCVNPQASKQWWEEQAVAENIMVFGILPL